MWRSSASSGTSSCAWPRRCATAPRRIEVGLVEAVEEADAVGAAPRDLADQVGRYLSDGRVRDRVHLQLNRSESRHELARRLFFANQGSFRTGDYEEIINKVSALTTLSNAVLVWNTVHFAHIVASLKSISGEAVTSEDLARVSPLANAHVIPSGTYRFARAGRARAALTVLHVGGWDPWLVAAGKKSPSLVEATPSVSASNWLTTLRPAEPRRLERRWPMASTSSRNMTVGAARRAFSKSSWSLRSLSPSHMSRTSVRPMALNRAPSSPASARARKVLPHPGGP